jgi:hypothetical protein
LGSHQPPKRRRKRELRRRLTGSLVVPGIGSAEKLRDAMGAWIDQNLGVFITLLGLAMSAVVYAVRMEGMVSRLETRISSCERRADEDRNEIKAQLSAIGADVGDVKETLNQLVGAYGRRSSDAMDPSRKARL